MLLTWLFFGLCFEILFVNSSVIHPVKISSKIVGGDSVDIREIPHQVSLQTRTDGHFCGGSIINNKWIISAAHCTTYVETTDVIVQLGSSSIIEGDEGILVNVAQIVNHPNYDNYQTDYYISLLQLQEEIQFDETKSPVQLPLENESISDGTLCKVSGWGDTLNIEESNIRLRVAEIPIINQKECIETYKSRCLNVTDRMFCAGFWIGGKDSCQGDSGGPLTVNNTLIGIVSWGYGCAEPNYPGVYTRVASLLDWIKQISGTE